MSIDFSEKKQDRKALGKLPGFSQRQSFFIFNYPDMKFSTSLIGSAFAFLLATSLLLAAVAGSGAWRGSRAVRFF
jgi:hypothetical protein